jgi:hypothetical protein
LRVLGIEQLESVVANPSHNVPIVLLSRLASFKQESGRSFVSACMSHSHEDERFSDDLQHVADVLRDGRPTLDPLALDRVKLRAMSAASRPGASQHKGSFVKQRLTTLITVGFLILGTGGTLALAGVGGGSGAGSASFNQYKPPCVHGKGLGVPNECPGEKAEKPVKPKKVAKGGKAGKKGKNDKSGHGGKNGGHAGKGSHGGKANHGSKANHGGKGHGGKAGGGKSGHGSKGGRGNTNHGHKARHNKKAGHGHH